MSSPRLPLAVVLLGLLLAACTAPPVTPGISAAPASVTPGKGFSITVVGYAAPFTVTICDRAVDDLSAVGTGGETVLSGTVPLMPGRTCAIDVSAGDEGDRANVEVVELLAGVTVGIFANDDALDHHGEEGAYRFTAYLRDLESGDLFDLTVYGSFDDYRADVAAGTAPELMFFSFAGLKFTTALWDGIEAHLSTADARAVIMSYCIGSPAAAIFGLSGNALCYDNTETVSFAIDPWLTGGPDAPLDLAMSVEWSYAATYDAVATPNEVFCTNAADATAVCGTYHAERPAALALWLPEAMVGGQNDELLLQIARSLF
jgi:hypothetical protein